MSQPTRRQSGTTLLGQAGSRSTGIEALRAASRQRRQDAIVVEEPLEIRVSHAGRSPQALTVTMRTPGDDFNLAIGFLRSEGLIRSASDVTAVGYCGSAGNIVRVDLASNTPVPGASSTRAFFSSSSCGVCGKASIDEVRAMPVTERIDSLLSVSRNVLQGMPARLRAAQGLFETTGGLHAVGLFSGDGELRWLHEDVGRHNAMDKLVGAALQRGELPLRDSIALLSGRASFELLQKASVAGLPIVAAIGAPSTLAVEVARTAGQTLVGFLRAEGMNIYCGGERIR